MGDLEVGLTDLGFKALVIVIGDTKGTHDLVLNDILKGPKQDIWWHRNLGVYAKIIGTIRTKKLRYNFYEKIF